MLAMLKTNSAQLLGFVLPVHVDMLKAVKQITISRGMPALLQLESVIYSLHLGSNLTEALGSSELEYPTQICSVFSALRMT